MSEEREKPADEILAEVEAGLAADLAKIRANEPTDPVIERGANGQAVEHLNIDGETVEVDAEIAPLVRALNAAGVATVASCSGHGHRPGNIALRDGREIIIARDYAEARSIDNLFPLDINGNIRRCVRSRVAAVPERQSPERFTMTKEHTDPVIERLTDDEAEATFIALVETLDKLGCCPAATVANKEDEGVSFSLHFSATRARQLIARAGVSRQGNERLIEALEPFARTADKLRDNIPNAVNVFAQSPLFVPGSTDSVGTVSDFRRARAALKAIGGGSVG